MRAVPGQRERVLAVVRALKMSGVRVRNWKNFIQTQNQPQEMVQPFAFGRELNSLPQHHLTDPDGTVPLFLVEVCEYLSHHLHTEGLFRKTGSLSRIRALRVALEQGECVLRPPRDALLQPCDVASLLKQFLRELPEPLITVELQSAMIQAQTLENPGALEKTTLLVTTLLPPLHARTLRYLCTFLRRVSLRCDENRMEVGNLALVMAPNLLQSPFQNCRLTTNTEKQLDQQTAVIRTLILHAEHIGVLPAFVLDSVDCVEVQESTPVQSKKPGLSVYRSVRRQRRRSVGEMFVDAFSKLKPVRTPTGAALTSDASLDDQLLSTSPNPQSPSAVKRKASEEPPPEEDGSAKKRRSLRDLRADSSLSADDSTGGLSPQAARDSEDDLHPYVTKRRAQVRAHRKSYCPLKQEEQVHGRKRTLRFFSTSSSSAGSSPMIGIAASDDPEPSLHSCRRLRERRPSPSDSETSLRIPFILIQEPGAVVVGSEVEDDPDLLNCSFVENPEDDVLFPESPEPFTERQNGEELCGDEEDEDDRWVLLEDGEPEVVLEHKEIKTTDQPLTQSLKEGCPAHGGEEPKQTRRPSKKGSRPRRSISMPEVALEQCSDESSQTLSQKVTKNPGFEDMWSASVNLPLSDGKKERGKEKGGRENPLRRKYASVLDRKKDKVTDADPGIKRTQQRMSVADRLRSFSVLASFLRTTKAVVPQRTATRLRRQGARRFSRSFSHDSASEFTPGESPQEQQAFLELGDAYVDGEDSGEPAEGLRNVPSPTLSVEELTLLASPQRSEEKEYLQTERPESQAKRDLDLDKQLEQQCNVTEETEDDSTLTEPQCNISDPHALSVPESAPVSLSPCHSSFTECSADPESALNRLCPHCSSFRERCTDLESSSNTHSPRYSGFRERCTDLESSSNTHSPRYSGFRERCTDLESTTDTHSPHYSGFRESCTNLESASNTHSPRYSGFRERCTDLESTTDTHSPHYSGFRESCTNLESASNTHSPHYSGFRESCTNLESASNTHSPHYSGFRERCTDLESSSNTHSPRYSGFRESCTDLESSSNTHSPRYSGFRERCTDLESSSNTHSPRYSGFRESCTDLESTTDTHSPRYSGFRESCTDLESTTDTHSPHYSGFRESCTNLESASNTHSPHYSGFRERCTDLESASNTHSPHYSGFRESCTDLESVPNTHSTHYSGFRERCTDLESASNTHSPHYSGFRECCTDLESVPNTPSPENCSFTECCTDPESSPDSLSPQFSSFTEDYTDPESASNSPSPPYSSFTECCTDPEPVSPCKVMACLSLDDLISISSSVTEKCSLSLDRSPPAFQFQQRGSRRRYRDSPRWPSHQVRMTTWRPLQL